MSVDTHLPSQAKFAPPPGTTFRRGKFIGETYEDVAQKDRQYAAWAIREQRAAGRLPRSLARFVQYVSDVHGGVMSVGKHKGLYFDELLRDEPEYVEWCLNVVNPNGPLKDFVAYALQQEENPKKRARGVEPIDGRCAICLERPLSAAWVPCGHTVACYECATATDGRCPVCRQHGFVQKLFVG